ncbi:MAG: 2-isopropylmalate synthase [Clostridiaceae bacterium]|nr:2-isopropylmalate synthase [Clostridiaceae bacterium]
MNFRKYRKYPTAPRTSRKWPERQIERAPVWCSVDLRDGNQALEIPMDLEQKLAFFGFLVETGFKEIEVGFPAASDTEFAFTRALIEKEQIPEDVVIQVLTQSRPHIIAKTFEALKGANKAIVHLYNSTSTLQRDVVFRMDKAQVIELAVSGAKQMKEYVDQDTSGTEFWFEYSPESFTGTELDYAAEICNAVMDVWRPDLGRKVIINLPATIEMSTPNVYADQIETMCESLKYRDRIQVSLHPHNDRGCAVAATELGLMAGADRVEGTLFGNGERTGNADILVLGMNLFSQGIDPKLDFSHIDHVVSVYENATGMVVHPRHPYAGDLVFTAFSGSHQDAINKGMARIKEDSRIWAVPYLPIDPADIGRTYEPIIRINSQSGKGGVSYILEQNYGLHLPKPVQQVFSLVCTRISDNRHSELLSREIYELFINNYVNIVKPIRIDNYQETAIGETEVSLKAQISVAGEERDIEGSGSGLLSAFCSALNNHFGTKLEIQSYSQHALERGTQSQAITYVQISNGTGESYIGAGISSNVSRSSLRAVVSAWNNYIRETDREIG